MIEEFEEDSSLNDLEPQENTTSIISEFETMYETIESDIDHITTKLSEIQRYISIIENDVTKIEQHLLQERDLAKKEHYYKALKFNLTMIAPLQDVYQRFLSIKEGYRRKQSDLIYSKNKLVFVDIPNKKKFENNVGNLNELLTTLSKRLDDPSERDEIVSSIKEIDEDVTYTLR